MRFDLITLFRDQIEAALAFGVVGRARTRALIDVQCFDPRDDATDNYRTIDERPYGGGPGMVMMIDPLRATLRRAQEADVRPVRRIYLSPQGPRLRGHRVTVLARDPARVTEKHERLSVAKGDVLEKQGLAQAITGQDVVISAVGTARAKDPDYTLYLRAADSLIETLRGLGDGAPRLIVVGGVGSLVDSSGAMVLERVPRERKPEHQGQKAALDFYRSVSDVRWTYVSPPGRIAPGTRKGVYRTADDQLIVDARGESSISMEDYAVALIDEAENPRHDGRRFTVGY